MFKFMKMISWVLIIVCGTMHSAFVVKAADKPSLENDLRGAHFKVYGFQYPPFMYVVKDSIGNVSSYEGFNVQFIGYIVRHLNMNLEYVPENSEEVKKFGQGLASVIAVQKEEVDLSTHPLNLRSYRLIEDSTTVAYQENYILLNQYPEEESRLTAVIRPFNYKTWIAFSGSTVAFVIFVSTLVFFYHYWRKLFNFPREENTFGSFLDMVGNSAMYVLAILTQHGGNLVQHSAIKFRFSLRIMLGLWLLMMIIMINLYGSTLTSYLTVTKLKPTPTSLEELAANVGHQKCLLTVQKGHPVLAMIQDSKYAPYKKIKEWTVQNPQFLTNQYSEITDNVVNHGCSHIGTPISSGLRVAMDYKNNNGTCRMTMSKSLDYGVIQFPFALPKNSPYTETVNKYLLQAISAGLMEYWKKWSTGSTFNLYVCQVSNNQASSNSELKPIKLIELSSAFLVLGIGLTLATIAFIIEKISWLLFIYSKKRTIIIM